MKRVAKETSYRKPILVICMATIVVIILATACVKKFISKYNECVERVPSSDWFEEDLEETFLTTCVHVLNIDDDGDGRVVVEIYVEGVNGCGGTYYRCLYAIDIIDIFNIHWALVRYIETSRR